MTRPVFPAIEDWRKMSEGEQDALLDALEAGRRRRVLLNRLAIGFACLLSAVAALALLQAW
jgi:hypothetical protein